MLVKKDKRRYLTLIEIIIVITLITMLMGVMAWNIPGILEKGKASKTEIAIARLESILNIAVANNPGLIDEIDAEWEEEVIRSGAVKNPNQLIYDGWGNKFDVGEEDGEIYIISRKYDDYKQRNP